MQISPIVIFFAALIASGIAGYVTRSWLVAKHASHMQKLNYFGYSVMASVISVLALLACHVAEMSGIAAASTLSNVLYCVFSYSACYVLGCLANGSIYTK